MEQYIDVIIKVVLLIFGGILVPMIKKYINAHLSEQQLQTLVKYVTIAVRCAEQIYTKEEWREKKEYVLTQAKDFVIFNTKLQITEEQLDTLIEGIVNEVKSDK